MPNINSENIRSNLIVFLKKRDFKQKLLDTFTGLKGIPTFSPKIFLPSDISPIMIHLTDNSPIDRFTQRINHLYY